MSLEMPRDIVMGVISANDVSKIRRKVEFVKEACDLGARINLDYSVPLLDGAATVLYECLEPLEQLEDALKAFLSTYTDIMVDRANQEETPTDQPTEGQ